MRKHSPLLLMILAWLYAGVSTAADLPPLSDIHVKSTLDGTMQPSRLWVPEGEAAKPAPLLVSLHSWSGDYTQDRSDWQTEAVAREWIYLQPNFRGVNDHPEACGSPLARQDILDAIDWVVERHNVDTSRIYLGGASGGGHMSLLMAARHPERFSAVSAWVGITDLEDWYRFHSRNGEPERYAQMIAASCGGPPGASAEVDEQYRDRSSIHFLQQAVGLPLDIAAGVKDGKTGSVPIRHSLRAFNVVAKAGGHETIPKQRWTHCGRTADCPIPSRGTKRPMRRTAATSCCVERRERPASRSSTAATRGCLMRPASGCRSSSERRRSRDRTDWQSVRWTSACRLRRSRYPNFPRSVSFVRHRVSGTLPDQITSDRLDVVNSSCRTCEPSA